ncbi:SDR family oxidoreductase [Verticiella sediminum]|uniref:SDR family oxidoreductase n=2 Tax=Verticiella sediminum TaxID=1247510 RepID=A0A556AKQ6_9BURK|nr:SDR family oxidoreductase [Verticiella sediminum]TSH93469.1 SDR family oxidoreductase [Verticiella sediminum]
MVDKVVIVTGGGGALGKAIAAAMAAEGASVVVNDLGVSLKGEGGSSTVADMVAAEITSAGGRAIGDATSITTFDNAQQIVQRAVDTFGRVDAVVNSAGILRDAIFHKMEEAEFDAVMKVHLYGAWNMSRAAAPHFRQQGSGAFVHMTSAAGLIGSIGQANYAAAKMGIVGLSRSIAMEMQRFGVRSNCIAPHAFGRMIESVPGLSPEQQEAYMAKRRATTRADQVAPLAVFLCSDGAKDISGQIFGARGNEVYLYSQPRPIRVLQRGDGWTSQSLASTLPGAWRSSLTPLERTRDVFPWDAV